MKGEPKEQRSVCEDMDCYDRLPQPVRLALRQTVFDWSARQAAQLVRLDGMEKTVAFIHRADAKEVKRNPQYQI